MNQHEKAIKVEKERQAVRDKVTHVLFEFPEILNKEELKLMEERQAINDMEEKLKNTKVTVEFDVLARSQQDDPEKRLSNQQKRDAEVSKTLSEDQQYKSDCDEVVAKKRNYAIAEIHYKKLLRTFEGCKAAARLVGE